MKVPRGLLTGPQSPASKNLMQQFVDTIPVRSEDDDSEIILGSGEYRYRLVNDWAKIPNGWTLSDVGAVAVDPSDRVYVFNRSDHPMMIFDPDGNMIDHWGEGVFTRAHGVHRGPDGSLYCTDDGDHSVRKCTPEGKVLLTLGIPGKPAPFMSGDPFCRCTDVALSPTGDIYVSDGYYNARVHKYSPDGKLLFSWGEPGTRRGQFNIPHNICCDADGWVYVADRENHRVQVFDGNGKYETQWNDLHRTCALEQEPAGEGRFYVGELPSSMNTNRHIPNIGPRVSILSKKGEVLGQIGELPPGTAPDRFLAPLGIAIDSRGDIYLGEVAYTYWPTIFPGIEVPEKLRTLRKLVRVA